MLNINKRLAASLTDSRFLAIVFCSKVQLLLLLTLLMSYCFSYGAIISRNQSQWTLILHARDGGSLVYEEKEMSTVLSSYLTTADNFQLLDS